MNEKCHWVCYVIGHENQRATYCGMSNNVVRRLRQHNGEIKGGARYTSRVHKGCWTPLIHVRGFQSRRQVAQFEWAMKKRRGPHKIRSGHQGRVHQLEYLLGLQRLNKEYNFANHISVTCFLPKKRYLELAQLQPEEFETRRKEQMVPFFFRDY